MKNILFVLAVALLGVSFAQDALTLTFDDAQFPYYELDHGYVSLSLGDETLSVNLHNDASSGMKLEFAEKIGRPTEEGAGDTPGTGDAATYSQRELRDRAGVVVAQRTVELTHQDASLSDVIDGYSAMLAELGFSRSTDQVYPNTRVFLFDHQGRLLRGFFTRVGDEIRVRLTTAI